MSPVWDADNAITTETAELLISSQFPSLPAVHAELIGVGWDNSAFLLNGGLVFRFPRRRLAAGLLQQEMRVLPLLAPVLPLPIPVPEFHGAPQGEYPYEFAGYRLIPGVTACEVDWTDEARAANAPLLAQFLSALHSVSITAEVLAWAPRDEIRRADVQMRAPHIKERLASIASLVESADLEAVNQWFDQLANTPLREEPVCWVHGDLYPRHLLVDDNHRLCGVIDWGDVHLGDPAIDLSIVYSFLPPPARSRFWEAYGPVDENTLRRARFRALHYGVLLIDYGADVGDPAIRRIGKDALRFGVM